MSVDIESRLSNYRVKLTKLDALIASDASNASLASLKADLIRVISTEEAALARARAAPAAAGSAASARAPSRFVSGARVAVTVLSAIGSSVTAAATVRSVRADGLVDVIFIGTTGPPGKPAMAVAESALAPLEMPATAFAAGDLRAGVVALARFTDGDWYKAEVEAVLSGGTEVRVRFSGYNNVEVVPREYLKRADVSGGGGADSGAAGGVGAGGVAAVAGGAAVGALDGAAGPASMAAFRVRGRPVVAATSADAPADDGADDDNIFSDFVVPDVRRIQRLQRAVFDAL